MSMRIVFSTLLSALLLGSCSSPSDIRPEVAQPLDKARMLANGWADKAAIMALLNQAASAPNLNKAERHQIRTTGEYALARVGHGNFSNINAGTLVSPPPALGWTGLH